MQENPQIPAQSSKGNYTQLESHVPQSENESGLDLVELFFEYLRNWKWFLLSGIVVLGLTVLYLLSTTPNYKVTSKILIKDEKGGQVMDITDAFNDLGLGLKGSGTNIENEIEILKSENLLKKVADTLGLYATYYQRRGLRNIELYDLSPVLIRDIQYQEKSPGIFKFEIRSEKGDSAIVVEDKSSNEEKRVKPGELVIMPDITFRVIKNPTIISDNDNIHIDVAIRKINYKPSINVTKIGKYADVIEISAIGASPRKQIDVVSCVIDFYNEQAVADKKKVSEETIAFIDNRLADISGELTEAELDVERYKQGQNMADLEAEGQAYLSSSSEYGKLVAQVELKLNLLSSIENYLNNSEHKDQIVPSNLGIEDPTLSTIIQEYNQHQLEKARITKGMSQSNPVLKTYEERTALLRNNLMESVRNVRSGLRIQRNELQKQENLFSSRIRNLSTKERRTRELYRQQSIKETLFIYLMKKREEAGLFKTAIMPTTKVIESAHRSPYGPVKPRKAIILLAGILIALLIPAIVIYLRKLMDYKISNLDELASMVSIPLLGEIPINTTGHDVLTPDDDHTAIGEKFRLVCANLDFMLSGQTDKSVMITSSVSGEGKSFFAANLASALSHIGKKTLLVNLDVRKADLAELYGVYSKIGITSYLSDNTIKPEEVIKKSGTEYPNLDIIPAGIIPPNPVALISGPRLSELFNAVKGKYDYIIIDTPPVGLVADALLVNKFANLTIYVVRAQETHKNYLHQVQHLYDNDKLKNMALILNSVDYNKRYGAYGKYGYYVKDRGYYLDNNTKKNKKK